MSDVELYRLKRVEDLGDKLALEKADVKDLNELFTEVRSLRRTLVQFMVTIAGSSVLFAFAVLQLTAGHA